MPVTEVAIQLNIVVVDDDSRLSLPETFLSSLGATLTTYESPTEARQELPSVIRQSAATVIILDLMFPSDFNDGLTYLRELKQVYTTIPVIIFTAALMPQVREPALRAGADMVLQKGCDPQELRTAIMFASGHDVTRASVRCEVVRVDGDMVRVRINGRNGWVAEREFDAGFCPPPARQPGGTFWLDTVQRLNDGRTEYTLRGRPVDSREESATLDEWFRGV